MIAIRDALRLWENTPADLLDTKALIVYQSMFWFAININQLDDSDVLDHGHHCIVMSTSGKPLSIREIQEQISKVTNKNETLTVYLDGEDEFFGVKSISIVTKPSEYFQLIIE